MSRMCAQTRPLPQGVGCVCAVGVHHPVVLPDSAQAAGQQAQQRAAAGAQLPAADNQQHGRGGLAGADRNCGPAERRAVNAPW